jgi:hypothetical protein
MAEILDSKLLERLEAVLARQEGDVPGLLPAGLSENEVRAGLSAVGLDAPQEALVWWSRHDGWRDESSFEVLPGLQSVSLTDAVDVYRLSRAAAEWYAFDPEMPVSVQRPEPIGVGTGCRSSRPGE